MKFFLITINIFFISVIGFAQDRKNLTAQRVAEAPKIDGVLDDDVWKNIPIATDFIQREPKPGIPAKQKTEVKIIYDDIAIYIAAQLYDDKPDSILRELSQRDNEANADLFAIFFDTYNDDINAYGFATTSAGVQIDGRYSSDGQDLNWNAVWNSAISINEKGWCVEFKIPYSALRFPNKTEQIFGFNVVRKIRKTREQSWWNEQKPEIDGLVNQFGDLLGIANIKAPLRLSITPYISTYFQNEPNETGGTINSYSINGGMDVKYGINESFTLDMTLIPDFGQVQSDRKVLNLSPFEVKYDENRQFFTEGTELFNRAGLFYSRRIGGYPVNYDLPYDELKNNEYIKDNPTSTQLYNATKLSGRTKKNLGIGVFNATSANTYATISDSLGNERKVLTQPLANYNVIVFDQALKNNSYISLINTNVTREGKTSYNANVTGTEFKFANKSIKYGVFGKAALSQLYYHDTTKTNLGYMYSIGMGKISGQLTYNVQADVKSNKYNPNDLGILFINNTIETSVNVGYSIFQPFWKLNEFNVSGSVNYSRLYEPSLFSNFNISGEIFCLFTKKFLANGGGFDLYPVATYDHWEARTVNRYYVLPKNYAGYYFISTDYRKRFALDVFVRYQYFDENNRYNYNLAISPRYRVNNKLSFNYNFNRDVANDDIGFVNHDYNTDIISFGRRNVITITNELNANYIFTNKMSLTLRGRHYWSTAEYKQYYTLSDKGLLFDDAQYAGNSNVNFNAFNIDMVYRWQFSPGSEMSIVWKNAIYTRGNEIVKHYSDDFSQTINAPQTNSFSIKVLYYLDYAMIKRKRKN